MKKAKIVIVGSGFGGVYTARYLARHVRKANLEVTLINRTNFFLFTPLLHEVATGGLGPLSVTEPLREIFRNSAIEVRQGTVTAIDLDTKTVTTDVATLSYDYLILACGAETNFYGVPGAREYSLTLKNISDAVNIRNRIISCVEKAVQTEDSSERARLLSFVVVGGGATGVEFVAELAEFVRGTLFSYHKGKFQCEDVKITLVHSGKEILPHYHELLRNWASETLVKKGVRLLLDTAVSAVLPHEVILADKTTIPAATVLWSAGVKPVMPSMKGLTALHPTGRIVTDPYLRAEGRSEVFVLGDMAAYTEQTEGKKPLPMLAQVAVQEARIVAKNLVRVSAGKSLCSFHYNSRGTLLSLGQWMAVGEIYGVKLSGWYVWWLWRTVYLFTFLSWRKRFRVAFEWTINLFYPRDITAIH